MLHEDKGFIVIEFSSDTKTVRVAVSDKMKPGQVPWLLRELATMLEEAADTENQAR